MAKLFPHVSWACGTNIYEVNTRQYTPEGTFNAFAKHIPRLHKMGVEVLWFMPITPISKKGRKGTLGSYYACSSYTKINEEYGTLEDFKALIKQAHKLGMKVIIDWVANHTGVEHEWNEHPEYYKKNEAGEFYDSHGWEDVIDLDYTNRDMRNAMIKAMQYWVSECDLDGFRCDMAHLVPLDFWNEARHACEELKHLFWLAESEQPEFMDVFDATYGWQFMTVSESVSKGNAPVKNLKQVLYEYSLLPAICSRALFTTNHDENSWNGTEYEKYGNGTKALAAFTATFMGVPLIYSGQELPNKKRLDFFEKENIDWTDNPELHDFYHTLLSNKKSHAALAQGDAILVDPDTTGNVIIYIKKYNNETAFVIINFSHNDHARGGFTNKLIKGKYKNIMTNRVFDLENDITYNLEPWEFHVLVSV